MSIGKIVGIVIFAGAAAAVWLWPQTETAAAPEETVRPVRSCVVGGGAKLPEMRFAGKVKAKASRTLRFKQAGRIQRIPVSKGQAVRKGDRLAWLFPEDFRNRLQNAEAAAERDRLSHRRIADAAKKNAVSREDLSKAEAQLRQSEANLELAKRALEETVILAPFDGTVADVPGTELDLASASYSVVVLQDMSDVRVEVAIPETVVIVQPQLRGGDAEAPDGACQVQVVFDSCPGRSFPASFLEYTAAADVHTQTYAATYVMKPVDDLLLLPGMSATVVIPAGSYRYDKASANAGAIDIPESCVGVDGHGGYFAWKLVEEGGVHVAHRVELRGCMLRVGGFMTVREGVKAGDRLATAGVAVLTEGRRVTLLKE